MSEAKAYPDTIEQVGKILAQHFSFDFVFLQQILIRRFDRNRTRQMRPHARANLIETKITLGLEVQKNGFAWSCRTRTCAGILTDCENAAIALGVIYQSVAHLIAIPYALDGMRAALPGKCR